MRGRRKILNSPDFNSQLFTGINKKKIPINQVSSQISEKLQISGGKKVLQIFSVPLRIKRLSEKSPLDQLLIFETGIERCA